MSGRPRSTSAPSASSATGLHVAPGYDAGAFAEATIAGLLSLICLSPQAKRRLGVKAASRCASGWPAWYLWLAGMPGVHEIVLPPPGFAERMDNRAELAVRYYPHPDESAFAHFAPVERSARTSPLFDATGTPAIDAADEIEPSLFHIATIALAPNARGGVDFGLDTQVCWRETTATARGPVSRRSVAGLELAAPLFDLLICGQSYHGRRPPRSVDIALAAGTAWHVDEGGRAVAVEAPGDARVLVQVRGAAGLQTGDDALWRSGELPPIDPGQAEIVLSHSGALPPPAFEPFAISDWWQAARWRFYPVAAMCGCLASDSAVTGRNPGRTNGGTAS